MFNRKLVFTVWAGQYYFSSREDNSWLSHETGKGPSKAVIYRKRPFWSCQTEILYHSIPAQQTHVSYVSGSLMDNRPACNIYNRNQTWSNYEINKTTVIRDLSFLTFLEFFNLLLAQRTWLTFHTQQKLKRPKRPHKLKRQIINASQKPNSSQEGLTQICFLNSTYNPPCSKIMLSGFL